MPSRKSRSGLCPDTGGASLGDRFPGYTKVPVPLKSAARFGASAARIGAKSFEAFLQCEELREVNVGGSERLPLLGVRALELRGIVAELAECPRGSLLDLDAFAPDETE